MVHTFITERATVHETDFEKWDGPGSPAIRVALNQMVSLAEIQSHLFFEAADERIRVTPTPRARAPGEKLLSWSVVPDRPLPLDAAIHLKLVPGLGSLEGTERSVASRTVLEFYTFPEHRFLGVDCQDNAGYPVRVRAGSSPPAAPCNPMYPVSLKFSSPVIKEVLRDHLVVEPDLAGGRKDYDPWENSYSYSRLGSPREAGAEFESDFPELLIARTTYRLRARAADLKDEFGRPLMADVALTFQTDDRPARLVLTHPVSVLC